MAKTPMAPAVFVDEYRRNARQIGLWFADHYRGGPDRQRQYALEGRCLWGATIRWLRDELRLIDDATDTGYFAGK